MGTPMARRTRQGQVTRNFENHFSQNQQAISTSYSSDALYTADDMVTLKRLIFRWAIAFGNQTGQGHGFLVLYKLPADMSDPSFSAADGQIVANALIYALVPFQFDAVIDGRTMWGTIDMKVGKTRGKLNPGDRIVVGRISTTDNLIAAAKIILQSVLEH